MANTQDIGVEQDPAAGAGANVSAVDGNVTGALSYLFGFVSGLIIYLIKRDNRFVRWHAAQSMAFTGLLVVASIVLTVVQLVFTTVMFSGSDGGFLIGSLVSLVLGVIWLILTVGGFVAWVYLMIKAYQGEAARIPVAAGIADRLA